jgi:uncharacterized protein (TIGR02118 family)
MKKGMIKVSVCYPNSEGKTFDIDYYRNKHLPLVSELLGDALKGLAAEKGLGGGAPGSPAPFAAIATMYFNSMEEFGQAFAENVEKLMADVPNYTTIEPIFQIGEVLL